MRKNVFVPLILGLIVGLISCTPREEEDPPEACFEIYPDDVVYVGQEVSFLNCSDNEDSYEWDFGDNETSKTENPDHTYTEADEYEVTLVVENNAGTDQITKTVTVLGLTGKWNKTFDIDGSPFNGTLTLEQDGQDLTGSFVFSDGSGFTQLLASSNVSGNNVLIKWNLQGDGAVYECSFPGTVNDDYDYMNGKWNLSGTELGSWSASKTSKKSVEISISDQKLTDFERFQKVMKK